MERDVLLCKGGVAEAGVAQESYCAGVKQNYNARLL